MRGGFREPVHFSFHFFDSSCLCNTQCVCSVQYTMSSVSKGTFMKNVVKCKLMQQVYALCVSYFSCIHKALYRELRV